MPHGRQSAIREIQITKCGQRTIFLRRVVSSLTPLALAVRILEKTSRLFKQGRLNE